MVNIPPPPPSMVVNISPPPALHGGEILTTPHKALTEPSPTGQAEHNDDLHGGVLSMEGGGGRFTTMEGGGGGMFTTMEGDATAKCRGFHIDHTNYTVLVTAIDLLYLWNFF